MTGVCNAKNLFCQTQVRCRSESKPTEEKKLEAEINKMASNVPQSEVECTCPVCCDIFTDPVLLLCGHSFCQHCLQEWWRQSSLRTCPVCKEMFHMTQPPRNLALRNLSDSLKQERRKRTGSKEICLLHGEKFKLFCQVDQQPICVICQDSKTHTKHKCVPINEAAEEYRVKIQINVNSLKIKQGDFEKQKRNWENMANLIMAQQTEKTIRGEFQKLYQFLRKEEAGRIDACRREAKLKSDAMNVRIINLTAEISELKEKIKTIEDQMRAQDLLFILSAKSTLERSLCKLQQPETPGGCLVDVGLHVGNLQFSVLKKMAEIVKYTPVFLDPNTCCNYLTVSENLTSSTISDKNQPYYSNPERMFYGGLLGYQGFNSGRHSWDVEVEVGDFWAVGVADKTEKQTWAMYICGCTNVLRNLTKMDYVTEIKVEALPQKVRVQLNYNQGIISFFDLDRKKMVHTIKYIFPETVFPYFRGNVKILPFDTSVSMGRTCGYLSYMFLPY
ncbi:E3 ubiquitin-protein ligase TRIM35-like isoform X2 [Gambusia affinis]|uniref:E3 ubiquitin-protein ligase TRIM35-like isoform X2 n=1 Tax=Gambusia affinis TaxID=33528 RepID=UPI001CDC31B9|nr:E3 ubiquitin-protein ligase TRIM35-like isoform X2 [Gambusia affinis]